MEKKPRLGRGLDALFASPENGAEATDEVRAGEMGHRGHGADVERLEVGAVHGVARAQYAPVQVLDFPGHGPTLRHQGASCR